jgi:hypothetical protein
MKKIQSIIENLINGNLTDAKEQAKRYSIWKIMTAAEEMGYTNPVQYVAIAGYLKGTIDFQKYCDTMNK